MLKLKRFYDPVSHTDGTRVLGERLWPRGLSKAKLQVSAWCKDAGPVTDLRKWFSHEPERWSRFRTRYFRELESRPEAWRAILSPPPGAGRGRSSTAPMTRSTTMPSRSKDKVWG